MHHKLVLLLIYVVICTQISTFADNFTSLDAGRQGRTFLYPFFSQMQLSMCTASPLFVRKFGQVAVNLGFQVMFNMPWRLQDFYRPMYWARAISDIVTGRITPTMSDERYSRFRREASGFTAGQLYDALEQYTSALDFHRDCLAKSVCELAQVPFSFEREDLIHDVVHLILTPSEHQSFHISEQQKKNWYETAENAGRSEQNCDEVYPMCEKSILSTISVVENGE
ncbi:uncharacterized protein LOC131681245 [Topomyia yanbarensis]|uniref:uncharacterized protein LOC131681245 n=1 Tax=Topomyia yanbarensis TaxID=2498891 RepID=UPI00273C2F08|nr:uncharacterized protein LOC131681245 [Topomyia yanbarensis]